MRPGWLLLGGPVALLLVSCSGSVEPGPAEMPPPAAAQPSPQVREVTLTALDNRFDPPAVTVRPGEAVRITVTNQGQAPHTFTLQWESHEIDLSLLPGESESSPVIVVAPPDGMTTAIPFRCRWHASSDFNEGMVGRVVVTDDGDVGALEPTAEPTSDVGASDEYGSDYY